MIEQKKLAAFLREAIRDGALKGIDHPFADAAREFVVDVDMLGIQSVSEWFTESTERATLIEQTYQAYNAPEEIVSEPVQTPEADKVVEALAEMQKRIGVLEAAKTEEPKAADDAEAEKKEEDAESEEETAEEA